jgi:hypothetical protein
VKTFMDKLEYHVGGFVYNMYTLLTDGTVTKNDRVLGRADKTKTTQIFNYIRRQVLLPGVLTDRQFSTGCVVLGGQSGHTGLVWRGKQLHDNALELEFRKLITSFTLG